jgi:hypothetical protein
LLTGLSAGGVLVGNAGFAGEVCVAGGTLVNTGLPGAFEGGKAAGVCIGAVDARTPGDPVPDGPADVGAGSCCLIAFGKPVEIIFWMTLNISDNTASILLPPC